MQTSWSSPKVITTQVPVKWREHEFVHLFARGTGLNNHGPSILKVDDNVLLDHAFYKGLYLAILDRRDLSLVYSGFYNTSTYKTNEGEGKVTHGDLETYRDFYNAHEMALKIREYDYNYFVVVLSQVGWESNFSAELRDALVHCGALNV